MFGDVGCGCCTFTLLVSLWLILYLVLEVLAVYCRSCLISIGFSIAFGAKCGANYGVIIGRCCVGWGFVVCV